MPLKHQKLLIINATSGPGRAITARRVPEEATVILNGRRKDELEELIHKRGKVQYQVLNPPLKPR